TPAIVRTLLASRTITTAPDGIGPFHGWQASFTLTEGAWNVCAAIMGWGGATSSGLGCASLTVPAP
ncbi:MAG: hypothetical protein RLY45_922, partial [Actinomycetota bacterium]